MVILGQFQNWDSRWKTPSHPLQRLRVPGKWGSQFAGLAREYGANNWNISFLVKSIWFVCQYLSKHLIRKEGVNLSLCNTQFETSLKSILKVGIAAHSCSTFAKIMTNHSLQSSERIYVGRSYSFYKSQVRDHQDNQLPRWPLDQGPALTKVW